MLRCSLQPSLQFLSVLNSTSVVMDFLAIKVNAEENCDCNHTHSIHLWSLMIGSLLHYFYWAT